MITYIIPARRGSKGFPFKNRILMYEHKYLKEIKDNLIISTDDEVIKEFCDSNNIKIHNRPPHLKGDKISTKDVILDVIDSMEVTTNLISVLYLTYPQRKLQDIQNAIQFLQDQKANSLLCRKDLKVHPFLTLKEEPLCKGSQITPHNLYRRQDYPKCFEVSHFISIFKRDEISKLNDNLYNENTVFFPIPDVLDIDYNLDYDTYKNNS